MRWLLKLKLFLIVLFAAPAFPSITLAANSCPSTDPAGLEQLIKDFKPKKLMFFSSWCSDCLIHLKSSEASDVILIAAFDKPERATKTLDKLNIKARRCVFDNGLTRVYGIKKVPAEIVLKHPAPGQN